MRQRTSSKDDFDYQVVRHNNAWSDHVARTNVTAGLIAWLEPKSIIDPACGDGSIVMMADTMLPFGIKRIAFSDISEPNCQAVRNLGYLEIMDMTVDCQSIMKALKTDERFDVIVLTEILEHLSHPVAALREARKVADHLVASSPEMRVGQSDDNPEHLWQFDGDGYFEMLQEGGWEPFHKTHMGFPSLTYDFQLWVCR